MALFAMLAVFTSPALAYACCCQHEVAATTSTPTPAIPSHPGCQGHHTGDTKHASPTTHNASNAHSVTVAASADSDVPCFKSVCQCDNQETTPPALVEKQGTSAFSPLVLALAVNAYSPTAPVSSALRFAFASRAARPRSPGLEHQSGRAPPAFSI